MKDRPSIQMINKHLTWDRQYYILKLLMMNNTRHASTDFGRYAHPAGYLFGEVDFVTCNNPPLSN